MKRGLPLSFLKVYLDFEILLLKFAYKHMHMGDFFLHIKFELRNVLTNPTMKR